MKIRSISAESVYNEIYQAMLKMNISLPDDVRSGIEKAYQKEKGRGKLVLRRILENLRIAEERSLPICQDTGMIIAFVELGQDVRLDAGESADKTIEVPNIGQVIAQATAAAYQDGFFRKSIVEDPVFNRINTGTNLPPIIHYDLAGGDRIRISLLAKGFGSENCSRVFMLNPTDGKDGIVDSVCAGVLQARGKPCPPIVVGVGIGGTLESAALLSKKALLRELDDHHRRNEYRSLERELLERINALGIGPGGVGSDFTALGVKVEVSPTHIAGLPVAVSINCWADRKISIEI